MRDYYKVVRPLGDKLVSAYIKIEEGGIEYRKGEWASSKCGPIFIFDSLSTARRFAKGTYHTSEVWEVEVQNVSGISFMISPSRLCKSLITRFWKKPKEERAYEYAGGSEYITSQIPLGTCVADKIKLVQRLEESL